MAGLEDRTLLDPTLFRGPMVFRSGNHAVMRGVERLDANHPWAGKTITMQVELLGTMSRSYLGSSRIFPDT